MSNTRTSRPNHGHLNVDYELCQSNLCSQRHHGFAETIDVQAIGRYVTSLEPSSIRPNQRGLLQQIVDNSAHYDHLCTATSPAVASKKLETFCNQCESQSDDVAKHGPSARVTRACVWLKSDNARKELP